MDANANQVNRFVDIGVTVGALVLVVEPLDDGSEHIIVSDGPADADGQLVGLSDVAHVGEAPVL